MKSLFCVSHLCQMSLVDLGKRLLEAARKGQDDEVRNLMANGAPFTTDWVRHSLHADITWLILLDCLAAEGKKSVISLLSTQG